MTLLSPMMVLVPDVAAGEDQNPCTVQAQRLNTPKGSSRTGSVWLNKDTPITRTSLDIPHISPGRVNKENNLQRRREAADFMRRMLGVDVPYSMDKAFRQALRDGVLLCRLLKKVTPDERLKVVESPNSNTDTGLYRQRVENIQNFLKAVEELGAPPDAKFVQPDQDSDCPEDLRRMVDFTIRLQMVEIYNESLRDLLRQGGSPRDAPPQRLDILSTKPSGCNVPGAVQQPVTCTREVLQLMAHGARHRHSAETKMNERSSRSHQVLTVIVDGVNKVTGGRSHGCLNLVDLAGSERVDRSQATGHDVHARVARGRVGERDRLDAQLRQPRGSHHTRPDTEGSFMAERLQDLAAAAVRHISALVAHRSEKPALLEEIALVNTLDEFMQADPQVRLVVVDSVTFHFRQDRRDMAQRTRLLAHMAQQFMALAEQRNLAVVIVNQVTTKVLGEQQSKLVPALGESWGHAASTRVILFWQSSELRAYVYKSPYLPPATARYLVTADGIRGMAPPSGTNKRKAVDNPPPQAQQPAATAPLPAARPPPQQQQVLFSVVLLCELMVADETSFCLHTKALLTDQLTSTAAGSYRHFRAAFLHLCSHLGTV